MKYKTLFFLILLLPLFIFSQAADLFFSEYIEGTSNNKAFEVFNGTGATVDLAPYTVERYNNGKTTDPATYDFQGNLANGDVFVIGNSSAVADILNESDVTNSMTWYNGDDVLILKKDGAAIDIFGVLGEDPGTAWDVAGVTEATAEHTLIRKSSVSQGNTNWASSAGTNTSDSEWIVNNQDDFTDLGQHTFDGGGPATGDGKGTVTVLPNEAKIDTTLDLEFSFTGVSDFTLTDMKIVVPSGWAWSGNVSDVVLSGTGFSTALSSITADTVFISSADLTNTATGGLTLQGMTAPSAGEVSVFSVYTSVSGGTLTEIGSSPTVHVKAPATLVTIEDIQNNFGFYDGQAVVVKAVVAIGINITRTDRCDVYIQDVSGRGINLSDGSTDFPDLDRGNLVRVEGVVSEYNGTTQIGSFTTTLISTGNTIPGIAQVSSLAAGNLDHEGTMIETSGIISDLAEGIGGGTNITINDGSEDIQMRIWDSSGLDFSGYAEGDTIGVRGVIDSYNDSPQLLVAYQEDIFKTTMGGNGNSDGKGAISVNPDEVEKLAETDLDFSFQLTGNDTIAQVELTIPSNWQWTSSVDNIELSGAFSGASPQLNGKTILLDNLEFTSQTNGNISVKNLTAPDTDIMSAFRVRTASAAGALTDISSNPVVMVGEGTTVPFISIEDARNLATGTSITVKGVITIGSGVTNTTLTSGYIQDESGFGINIFRYGSIDPDIKRGNLVLLEGALDEYNGVLEIVNYTTTILKTGVDIPAIQQLDTYEASTLTYEGSFCEVSGTITGISSDGSGKNVFIDDGSGEVTARVWQSTGVDLSIYEAGMIVTIRGAISIYQNAGQILLAYQEDIFEGMGIQNADGHGTVQVTPDELEKGAGSNLEFSLEANAPDTLAKVEIKIPGYWEWTSTVDNIDLAGAFSSADLSIDEKTILLENLTLTSTEQGIITIENLTAPDADTSSVFRFRTASPTGELKNIKQSPVILVGKGTSVETITIAQARKMTAGDSVTVKGTVVIGSNILRASQNSAYIVDESNRGINFFTFDEVPVLKRGDLVLVKGVLTPYAGSQNDTTLEITDHTILRVLRTNNTLPEPIKFTPTEAYEAGTEYEGSWVEIEGKLNSTSADDYGINLFLGDNLSEIIVRINNDTGIDISGFSKNDYINVKGIVGFYRGDFQVQPGYQDDIFTFDPSLRQEFDQVTLILPAKPFVPEKGEKLLIDYKINNLDTHITVRIFDLGGRQITTLFDGPPYNEDLLWNGRNQINELVPVGTYICHLEVVNNETGKRQVKLAPIVVGTVLSR